MGINLSKLDSSEDASKYEKRLTSDDVRSRSTAKTEESPVMVSTISLNASSIRHKASPNPSRRCRQNWRTGSRSAPNFAHAPCSRQAKGTETWPVPNLPRCDSDPGAAVGRRHSVPVKCPPRQSQRSSVPAIATPPHETEDSTYLMRMYNSRTWEMYRRITEARKISQCLCASNNNIANTQPDYATGESALEWENLQYIPGADEGHEMIFLFDFH